MISGRQIDFGVFKSRRPEQKSVRFQPPHSHSFTKGKRWDFTFLTNLECSTCPIQHLDICYDVKDYLETYIQLWFPYIFHAMCGSANQKHMLLSILIPFGTLKWKAFYQSNILKKQLAGYGNFFPWMQGEKGRINGWLSFAPYTIPTPTSKQILSNQAILQRFWSTHVFFNAG